MRQLRAMPVLTDSGRSYRLIHTSNFTLTRAAKRFANDSSSKRVNSSTSTCPSYLTNQELYGEGFQYKNSFYKYSVNLLFENLKPYLRNAIVVFDKCGNREFQIELKKYLGRRVNPADSGPQVKKIKTNESRSNNLLQLADMICGAVSRYLKKSKPDHFVYRKIISHRELMLRIWPR